MRCFTRLVILMDLKTGDAFCSTLLFPPHGGKYEDEDDYVGKDRKEVFDGNEDEDSENYLC
jgi:hypothetical protein